MLKSNQVCRSEVNQPGSTTFPNESRDTAARGETWGQLALQWDDTAALVCLLLEAKRCFASCGNLLDDSFIIRCQYIPNSKLSFTNTHREETGCREVDLPTSGAWHLASTLSLAYQQIGYTFLLSWDWLTDHEDIWRIRPCQCRRKAIYFHCYRILLVITWWQMYSNE